ncbi:MAG: dienelactone hydrolase family protein, partial [Alphaproteobacteria bacterium]|nr:dienelactone hydrolase family protein [Alphaproteobacteria bacterium]
FPKDFGAAASLYGVAIVTRQENSSHRLVKHIEAEMYYGFAEVDETVPDYVVPTLQRELD